MDQGERYIEDWISENNPCCNDNEYSFWQAGAEAMAEHLQSQPPTRETVDKVLDLLLQCCDDYMPITEEQEAYINYILKNWR